LRVGSSEEGHRSALLDLNYNEFTKYFAWKSRTILHDLLLRDSRSLNRVFPAMVSIAFVPVVTVFYDLVLRCFGDALTSSDLSKDGECVAWANVLPGAKVDIDYAVRGEVLMKAGCHYYLSGDSS